MSSSRFWAKLTPNYIKNNLPSFLFLVAFLFINIILIVTRFHEYSEFPLVAQIAKSCGKFPRVVKFFFMIQLIRTMSQLYLLSDTSFGFEEINNIIKKLWIWILLTPRSKYLLPQNYRIFHIYVCYHSLEDAHILFWWANGLIFNLTNERFTPDYLSKKNNVPLMEYLFYVRENTWPREYTPLTGWILLVVLIIMVISSLPFVRRTGNFEVFYYCHLLYMVFYLILIIHAPNFIYWFLAPGVIFLIEGLNRIIKSFGSHGYTYVVQGVLLPSRVVHLVIKRPANFVFSPGDWVFVQIPDIARTEWHPFTISSAPEMDEYLWLHIRAVGQWTNRVYDYFAEEEKKVMNNEMVINHVDPRSPIPEMSRSVKFQFPPETILRGISYPPSRPLTPVRDEESTQSETAVDTSNSEPSPRRRDMEGETTSMVCERKAKGRPKPPLFRALSTVDQRSIFKRQGSTVFCLPRPLDCDEMSGRPIRKPSLFYAPHKENEAHVEEGLPNVDRRSLMEKRGISIVESDRGSTILDVSGHMIKLEKPLHLHLDGPYGSPSSHIFHTEHAILIGAGIGVTPFASILQSITYKYSKAKQTCPACHHSWSDPIPPNIMHLKKVDFVWINRHQKSFEWFVDLLTDLEITQAMLGDDRFLDIHMYVTSARNDSDVRSKLSLAPDLTQDNERRDLVAGLMKRTRPGRPSWKSFFTDIQSQRRGRTTVFFCGPPELGRIIQNNCIPFDFGFRKENFWTNIDLLSNWWIP